jgi:hypothetical protein
VGLLGFCLAICGIDGLLRNVQAADASDKFLLIHRNIVVAEMDGMPGQGKTAPGDRPGDQTTCLQRLG